MPYLDINGYSLYYNINGSGTPLILISGGFSSSASWDSVRTGLAEHFTVIDFDRYGYGKSTRMKTFLKGDVIEFFVKELHTITEALNLDYFHLCGHCFGAAIAIKYAHTYPDKIGKMILVSPGIFSTETTIQKYDYVTVSYNSIPADLKKRLLKMHGADYLPVLWDWLCSYKSTYIMCPGYDISSELKKVKKPIFIMYADSDFYFDIHYAAKVYSIKKRNTRLWIAPATGHMLHQEKPTEFVEHTVSFLNET